MWAQLIKFIVIAIICYTGVCLWTRIFDPSINCSPLNFIISTTQAVICMSIKLIIFLLQSAISFIAALFGVTLNLTVPNIPCP